MYNTDLPRRADLPSSAQLKRSTVTALSAAIILLVTVVLPSEYAIDPTRVGRLLGLTEMGEIKTQLAKEAAQDAANAAPGQTAADPEIATRLARLERIVAGMDTRLQPAAEPRAEPAPMAPQPAPAPEPVAQVPEQPMPELAEVQQTAAVRSADQSAAGRTDEVSFTLPPGQGIEVKLVMQEGAQASFAWTANGATVNYDTHGDGGGQKISYKKGRGVAEDSGVLQAAFTGNHGWFWRNRTDADVMLTLRTTGDYSEIKRMN